MTPTVTVDADAIPDELKARPQWLLWDASADAPRRPHWKGDFSVSWTNPSDWHTFEEAYEAVEEHDSWGLGFVFAKGNDDYPRGLYTALDLDGCLNDRGTPKDWLPELWPFNRGTYIERSPSGGGLHIPLVGVDVPDWWTNEHFTEDEHEGVEFYDKKFFTFTGDAIDTSADSIGDIDPEDVHAWLEEVYETIVGEPPQTQPAETTPPQPRETQKSREELEDIETTNDYEDILDAIDHLEPYDLRLRSSKTEDENSDYESWDPGYRQSRSGKSLKRHKQSGVFFDMSNPSAGSGYEGFGVLDLFAAEQGIIHRPWDPLKGDDFKDAVSQARDAGANIPEYVGSNGDLPDAAKEVPSAELESEKVWEIWAEARKSLELDETSIIPDLALWHVAQEHTGYDLDALPDDLDELPPKAHNQALWWVNNRWPEQADLPLDDDESVTNRPYKSRDEAVYTWEDVRYIYDGGDGKPDKQGGRYAAVQLLRSEYDFATPEDTERLHIYESELGIYERTAELIVDRELDANLSRYYSQHEKNEILGRLRAGTYRPRPDFEAGAKDGLYLCVENGVIDLDLRELLDHDPSFLFTSRVPVEYDPDAEAERIGAFLDDITRREEDKLTMLEMVGNCFLPNYEYESFMVLFGEGANGKSTWYSIVRRLLGRENVSSMTLQKISDNTFAAANLLGKYANIGEDLPEKKISDVGPLKDLTGGGETFVEEKGKQGFDMQNRAKLMFAANRPPVLGEKSEAVKRRLVPVRLPYEFVPNPDPDDDHQKEAVKEGLVDSLTTESELSGLLNMALDGLDRLRDQGDVSLPESNDERLEYYEQFSDPIKEFAINCMENAPDKRVKKGTVYNAYTNFCRQNDYESSVDSVFWRQFRRTVLNVSTVKPAPNDDGDRPQYLDNAAFTEFGAQYVSGEDVVLVDDDGDEEADSAPSDVLAARECGYGHEFTATVENWSEGEYNRVSQGLLGDHVGSRIGFVVPGGNANILEGKQGKTLHFENVTIRTDEDGLKEAVITDAASVTSGEFPSPDSTDGDSPQPAATDGGGAEFDQLKPRLQRHIRENYESGDSVSAAAIAGELGEDPDRITESLDALREAGRTVARDPEDAKRYKVE